METSTTTIENHQYQSPQNLQPRERAARQYAIDAFRGKMPSLIPLVLENESVLKLASYLLKHTIGSKATLYQYVFGIHRYCNWINKSPDEIVRDSILDPKTREHYTASLEDFIGDLQAEGLAAGTIANHVKGVKALFRANSMELVLPYRLPKRVRYSDRAPTSEELTKMIDSADLREKVIVSLLALGGFRTGTLAKLQYRHVRKDIEAGVVPIHIHVEAEITKGKYGDYDTFLGPEAVNYLKLYLEQRRQGSTDYRAGKNKYMKPEEITDNSPLIRNANKNDTVKGVTPKQIRKIVHDLYSEAGLIKPSMGRYYELRTHSIRKYFKTQMIALGVQEAYVDYMMGHIPDTYHDIQSLGIEKLRSIYAAAGLAIRPKTQHSKLETIKEMIRALGENPEQILNRDALAQGATTEKQDIAEHQLAVLRNELRQLIKEESAV